MRSLRSRLLVGMLLGMAVLLVIAGATIYGVQRQQLYSAFDDTLLSSANTLALLVRPGPFGLWFDDRAFTRLPPESIRQGVVFQFWSDEPFSLPPQLHSESAPREGSPSSRAGGWRERPPPEHEFPEDGPPPRHPMEPDFWLPPMPEEWPTDAPVAYGADAYVVRARTLGDEDLPRLGTMPGRPRFENMTLPAGGPGRAVALQFALSGPNPRFRRPTPAIVDVVVAAGTGEVERQLRFLALLLAATAFGTMAVASGVAWLVVSRGLRPLDALARKMATMDETVLKERLSEQRAPHEIEPVIRQLNGLLGRLDQAFERERELTADVAHELRTPVAEIRAIAEITLARLRAPEEYRQAFGETLDTVRTLQGLIEKLLMLARLEAGQVTPDVQPVALKPRLDQHWSPLRDGAARRAVSFAADCPPDICVQADPELLDIVLANALSNAAAYVSDGGRVTATCEETGGRQRLTIANTGCHLTAAEVACVFERFWRADPARRRSGLNCGLGLSLVRRAMEAMGGQAAAHLSADGCFVLELTLAMAEEPADE